MKQIDWKKFYTTLFRLSRCQHFDHDFQIPDSVEFIYVKCVSMSSKILRRNKVAFYKNAHALIRRKKSKAPPRNTRSNQKKPISVLMFGLDSVSRLNLIRTMPNTTQHLYDSGWFELKGYNKVTSIKFKGSRTLH